jgi:hypothetical protein
METSITASSSGAKIPWRLEKFGWGSQTTNSSSSRKGFRRGMWYCSTLGNFATRSTCLKSVSNLPELLSKALGRTAATGCEHLKWADGQVQAKVGKKALREVGQAGRLAKVVLLQA